MFSSPTLIVLIMSVFAFALTIPLVGVVSRWILFNWWYGYPDVEHTAFNLSHFFNPFGFISLIFFGFGWGNIIHVDPTRIGHSHRRIKTILAYLTAPLVALASAIILLIPGLLISSRSCVYTALYLFLNARMQPSATTSLSMFFHEHVSVFDQCSSYALTATLFLLACIIMLWGLFYAYGIWSLCDAIMYKLFPHGPGSSTLEYALFLPLIIFFISGKFIAYLGLMTIVGAIETFSYYLGM